MKDFGLDYIDYWQSVCQAQWGLTTLFGIRVQDSFCSAVDTIDGVQSMAFGRLYQIPVQLEILPCYLRMIIDDHLLNLQFRQWGRVTGKDQRGEDGNELAKGVECGD